jgi:glycosyltransferase involved in cell wall biosynthesis
MLRLRSRAERRQAPPAFDPAPLDIWDGTFPALAASVGLNFPPPLPNQAEASEAQAAAYLMGVLRGNSQLRRRFPRALSEGEQGSFARWIDRCGAKQLGLSEVALKKIRGTFRRPPGKRVHDIYLHDPELQRLYPLGLLPVGQLHFLGWLTTHGRRDQRLTDEEILWFLHHSAEDPAEGLCLTYLLQPGWQERFPVALTAKGWSQFRRWIATSYRQCFAKALPRRLPALLSKAEQRSLEYSVQLDGTVGVAIEGVNILSHFFNPFGIRQAALWTKEALERVGLRTSCRDVPVPSPTLPANRAEWLGLEIFPFTILTHAGSPFFVSAYQRSGLFRRENVYRIAYWAWELERVPDEWVEAARVVNEIWSPTRFVADAMRSRISLPVFEMLPGVEVGEIEPVPRASLGIPENDLVFLFMFDLQSQLHRKNPLSTIRAFQKAFRADDAATLVIKATGGDVLRADMAALRQMCAADKVILVEEQMSRARAYGIIALCDCFISLHRSEGFGLGLAEAMLMGKPVIGTGYSGNLDFMSPENSMLVDYQLVEIEEDRPIYTKGNFWAEPSIDHAAFYLRYVYENRQEVAARAAQVQPAVREKLSLQLAGRRMADRLSQIASASGNNSLANSPVRP